MYKRFIAATIISIMLAGCSTAVLTTGIVPGRVVHKAVAELYLEREIKLPDDEEKINLDESEPAKGQEKQTQDSGQIKIPGSSQNPAINGEKLNFAVLSQLDNTGYSWWIRLNIKHETPGIPDYASKLIDKYDGKYIGDTTEKVIYLTFDEGYENGYTSSILDTLKSNGVKALFFVTGPYISTEKALVERMLNDGHQVGNHTINHPNLPAKSNSSLEKELYGLEKTFKDEFGTGFKYMRPPRGEYSERVLSAARQLGYKTVFWSFAYKDYDISDQKGAEFAYKKVMANLHNGAVILLHAVSKDNADALDKIIKGIKAQGYNIRPFDL